MFFEGAGGGSPSKTSATGSGSGGGSTATAQASATTSSTSSTSGLGSSGTTSSGASSGSGSSNSSSSGSPSTLKAGLTTVSLTVAGTARTAVQYVPPNATSTSPLVLALHGDGDTDTNFIVSTGTVGTATLKSMAEQTGFVLVAPQGITRDVTVNLGGGQTQTVPGVDWDAYNSAANGNIDLPFLEALRMQLQATGQVDTNRTFVYGYSQGGYMSFAYGLSYATKLSCAAVLAASSPFGGAQGDPLISEAARKIAVALQIGDQDPAYSQTQTTAATLKAGGFPTSFVAVSGAGHVPMPGDPQKPMTYCLGQTL